MQAAQTLHGESRSTLQLHTAASATVLHRSEVSTQPWHVDYALGLRPALGHFDANALEQLALVISVCMLACYALAQGGARLTAVKLDSL